MSGRIQNQAVVAVALLGLAFIASCDAGSFTTGPAEDGHPSLRVHADVAATTVTGLSVEVRATDINPALIFNISVSNGAASGTVRVPAGTGRQFTLRAYDAGGVETHRGTATVSIVDGTNPPLVVTLMPLEGEREIEASLGSILVVISPGADTMIAGDSLRLDAAVIDSVGSPVQGASVHWATLTPSIATVDSRGMVYGVAAGEAAIVATYGAVGSSSSITVTEETESDDPGAVTDLAAASVTTNAITLEWTQVDDGTGSPANYAVRYGSPTISWAAAAGTEVAVPGTAIGEKATVTFSGLASGTQYQFQLVGYRGTLNEDASFGQLSNIAGATTTVTQPGDPFSVSVSPDQVTLRGTGSTAQLTAEARDSDGVLIPDATFLWSSEDETIAIVSEEGLVTSTGVGNTLILAAVMCGSVACDPGSLVDSSDVTVTERSDRYPNEPAGFTPWFEHDWRTWPTHNYLNYQPGDVHTIPASGVGLIRQTTGAQNFELVDDPDAPHGKGRSLRHRQAAGQLTSSASGVFDLFNPKPGTGTSTNYADQVKLKSVYRSHWVYFEPHPATNDWQFGQVHMRTFWWSRTYERNSGISLASPELPVNLDIQHDHYRGAAYWFYAQDPQGTFASTTRIATPELSLPLGEWIQYEYLWETEGRFAIEGNDGMNNGRLRIWVDNTLVYDRQITHYLYNAFANDHFAMVWGGGSGEGARRQRDDFIRFGDIYISGEIH